MQRAKLSVRERGCVFEFLASRGGDLSFWIFNQHASAFHQSRAQNFHRPIASVHKKCYWPKFPTKRCHKTFTFFATFCSHKKRSKRSFRRKKWGEMLSSNRNPSYRWLLWRPVFGGDTFSALAPVLGPERKAGYVTLFHCSWRSAWYQLCGIRVAIACSIRDWRILGNMLEPARTRNICSVRPCPSLVWFCRTRCTIHAVYRHIKPWTIPISINYFICNWF